MTILLFILFYTIWICIKQAPKRTELFCLFYILYHQLFFFSTSRGLLIHKLSLIPLKFRILSPLLVFAIIAWSVLTSSSEAYLQYVMVLLELTRMENTVLGKTPDWFSHRADPTELHFKPYYILYYSHSPQSRFQCCFYTSLSRRPEYSNSIAGTCVFPKSKVFFTDTLLCYVTALPLVL